MSLGQHDVQLGQARAIFTTVGQEHSGAVTDASALLAELDTLLGLAQSPALRTALQGLKDEGFEPQLTSAEQRVERARASGEEVLGIVSQGDQEMTAAAESSAGQVPAQLDLPGAGGPR